MVIEPETETLSTRDRLRAAAYELFGERGYDGTSMADLAERVGIAKPSLYNYYRSKEELLLDLVEAAMGAWVDACMAPFDRPGTFELQLGQHLRRVVEFAREQPQVVAVFHMATSHVQGELAARVQALVDGIEEDLRGRIGRRIVEAIAAGELDARDPEDVHAFLAIFFHGILFLQTNCAPQAERANAHLPAIWTYLFRAIAGREPSESPFA